MSNEYDGSGIVPPYISERLTEEYYVTFGVQYGRRPDDPQHPFGMYADGYAVIEATDMNVAREIAHAIFDDKWAFIYDKDDFIHDGAAAQWHPAGELFRIKWVWGGETGKQEEPAL